MEAVVEIPGMPAVKTSTPLIVDTCVDTILLTSLNANVRVLRPVELVVATLYARDPIVDAPYAVPSAVEAAVEIPGMPALIRTSEAIVETWVDTTLLRPMKAAVKLLKLVELVVATA